MLLIPIVPLAAFVLAAPVPAAAWTFAAVPAVRSSDWPHWRGPARNGISPEEDWVDEGAATPLWSRPVGRGYSAPSVAGGRLFTKGFDEERAVDVTWALDALTGEVLWTHEHDSKKWDNMHGGGTLSTPVVADGVVYTLSRMGGIYALRAEDGELVWQRQLTETDGVDTGFFGLSSSPLVMDGELLLNVGPTMALDAQTGEVRWKTDDYGYSYGTPEPFTWNERELLAVFNAKGLTVMERDGGKQLGLHPWTSQYNVNCASPICFEGMIFISTGYNELGCAMLMLADEGLEVAWESKAMNSRMNGCVLFDGHLYGFDNKILKCLTLDGEERWRERGLGIGSVIVAGERLIVMGEEGELIVADATPEGFAPRARRQVFEGGPCWTTPVIAGGLIYCRDAIGELTCLDHRPTAEAR